GPSPMPRTVAVTGRSLRTGSGPGDDGAVGRNGRSAHRVLARRRTRGQCPEREPATLISARLPEHSAQLIDTRYQKSGTGRRTTRLGRYRTSNNPARSRATPRTRPTSSYPD